MEFRSRGASASELCCTLHETPPKKGGMERREAPGSWATPRGRMLPLARASGRGARHRTIRLREPPCFRGARRLPALHHGPRQGGRPPWRKTASTCRSAVAGDRHRRGRFAVNVTDLMTDVNGNVTGLFAGTRLLLPARGEKVGMRGRCRWAQNRGEARSPSLRIADASRRRS
jgi:hypothetical protein